MAKYRSQDIVYDTLHCDLPVLRKVLSDWYVVPYSDAPISAGRLVPAQFLVAPSCKVFVIRQSLLNISGTSIHPIGGSQIRLSGKYINNSLCSLPEIFDVCIVFSI